MFVNFINQISKVYVKKKSFAVKYNDPFVLRLEIRAPFLDHRFSSYYISLAPEHKQPADSLLRAAFTNTDLLPKLFPTNRNISYGISSVKQILQEHSYVFEVIITHKLLNECDIFFHSWHSFTCKIIIIVWFLKVSEHELEEASSRYPYNTPCTQEALFYRKVFESFYPERAEWIPDFATTATIYERKPIT